MWNDMACMVDWSESPKYSSLPAAENACAKDKTCNGIMDNDGAGREFFLCHSNAADSIGLEEFCDDWDASPGTGTFIYEPVAPSTCDFWLSADQHPAPAPPQPPSPTENVLDPEDENPIPESFGSSPNAHSLPVVNADSGSHAHSVPLPPVPPPMSTTTMDTVLPEVTTPHPTTVPNGMMTANVTNVTNTTRSGDVNATTTPEQMTTANATPSGNTGAVPSSTATPTAVNSSPAITTEVPALLLEPLDFYTYSGAQRNQGALSITVALLVALVSMAL
jgi:hypothetical protein